jgi:hypothetical protein
MTTITVTDAEVGTVLESDGVLTSVKMLAPPTNYSQDYFNLTDAGREKSLFNMHISTSFVSTDSFLMSGGRILFKELFLASMPVGSSFELETATVADVTPVLSSLSQTEAVAGHDPDFTLSCIGSNFNSGSVINFAGEEEPTVFVSDTEVTTIVKPSLFVNPDVVPVYVHTGDLKSEVLDFTFTEYVEEVPPE